MTTKSLDLQNAAYRLKDVVQDSTIVTNYLGQLNEAERLAISAMLDNKPGANGASEFFWKKADGLRERLS